MRTDAAPWDIAIIAVSSAMLMVGSAYFKLFDRLLVLHGDFAIGHVLSVALVAPIGLAAFAIRRWLQAGNEVRAQPRIVGQLSESERRFSAFFSHSPSPMFAANGATGVVTDVNEEMEHLLGMPRSHLIGRETHAIGLWSSAEEGVKLRQLIREQRGIRNAATIVNTVDGATRPVLLSAELIDDGQGEVLLGVLTDMTDRCSSEESRERRAFQEAIAALMNGVPRPVRRGSAAHRAQRRSNYIQSG